jgi:hypothetical protein
MDGLPKLDTRLADAIKIVLKGISIAWSRPEKNMDGFFRPNYLPEVSLKRSGVKFPNSL